ncbi:MAG TPA: nucleoside triphosphate pyrophosphohydrolase family protein [Candidatus Nanoarchaeia archaeon]|nr:nucleoside triphosphate pyrophosphohydrolase family protein [Candidatus Nanoarchaeia archaeon]
MNLKEYQELCKKTANTIFPSKEVEIMNWACGICGEAGDVAGCIKKIVAHKNDQTEGLRENLGDVMWYTATICNFYGWNMEEVLKENLEKLKKRYPNGFTFTDAQRNGTRVDWMEKNGKNLKL